MARRFRRASSVTPTSEEGDGAAVPDGAIVVAQRLLDDGHSRADVEAFLAESFRRLDVQATLDRLHASSRVAG